MSMPRYSFRLKGNYVAPDAKRLLSNLVALQTVYAHRAIAILRQYPPPRAAQTYVRTYTLRDSWFLNGPHLSPNTVYTSIENNATDNYGRPYAIYVQGRWQNRFHRGRWTRLNPPGAPFRALSRQFHLAALFAIARSGVRRRF